MSEYKPTKMAWFFGVIFAAGVGTAVVDGFKYAWNKMFEKDFKLELVDIWCRDKSCTFTVTNSGDVGGVMTAFSVDSDKDLNDQFRTTHPVGYENLKPTETLKTTSVAYLPAKSFIDIEFGNPSDYFPKKQICLFGRTQKWCSDSKELNKLVFKEL
ncbi:hypothetical protein NJR55_00475 [Idiomarina sp. M1R2S28]|uniref:Uncharacterized protein n=1 Tax=Idiomarina rhizosphaerae TaxID=2961572 RepID=A0A9X2JQR1_9GAMM|nr:hypothetical protein [Idiomarina rhizosphaerae]MCP1338053.1 hypothetical protein [Idiomarina rhizosphaerae]